MKKQNGRRPLNRHTSMLIHDYARMSGYILHYLGKCDKHSAEYWMSMRKIVHAELRKKGVLK